MVLVKVFRISSFTDPATSMPGKQIELVSVRSRPAGLVGLPQEEAAMLNTLMSQLQGVLMPFVRDLAMPKIILYLTEDEYEMLGIRFEVNDVYELEFKDGSIHLRKATESSGRGG